MPASRVEEMLLMRESTLRVYGLPEHAYVDPCIIHYGHFSFYPTLARFYHGCFSVLSYVYQS